MGVVRERKVVCESGINIPSNPGSTTNSGYNTQESEDEEAVEPNSPRRRRPLRTLRGINLNFNRNVASGKRRTRRNLNSKYLETLIEETEDDSLMEHNKSKFQILMENTDDAIEFLNAYNINSENDNSDECFCDDKENVGIQYAFNNPYFNIPRKIRAAIKSRKNFQYELLKSIETKLVYNFYPLCSQHEFQYYPETCYERMLVHAAARYNGFNSETIILNNKRAVKVVSVGTEFTPRTQLLCDYIEEMRRKKFEAAVGL